MKIEDEYNIYFKTERIGIYYIFDGGSTEYCVWKDALDSLKDEDIPPEFCRPFESKKTKDSFKKLMKKSNLADGTRKTIYRHGDVSAVRVPKNTERFSVYRRGAEKGDPDYSGESHSAPHCEGSGPIEGMDEWASWYCFNRRDDGTYEAELDEAWWWGGSHNDGGTMHAEIPEEWFDLPYDEFLENVITLVSAGHYGFTAEYLKKRKGLKKFFGFKRWFP